MNNIKYILILSLILMLGCVHRQNVFEPYETQVLLNNRYTLSLKSGTVSSLDTINENILYHVYFDQVKGGDTKLFGKWTITEGHGYKAKRLLIKERTNKILGVSIVDLKNSDQSVVNLNELLVD